jgi:SAM-dependent methyltransferase
MESRSFDPIWEQRYRDNPGYRSWYPWTAVVSFLLANAPKDRPRSEVRVLELGCGTGNNLWFAAREGFQASGVDCSITAVEFARERLATEGLTADIRVADFTQKMPFPDEDFDFIIDRAALSFTTREGATACIAEAHRLLKPGGLLQCSPYSDRDSSFYRSPDPDGAVRHITVGTITGGSQTCFYGLEDVRRLFQDGWKIWSLKHIEELEMLQAQRIFHCEWLAIAQKRPE